MTSADRRDRHSFRCRRIEKPAIASDDDQIRVPHSVCSRKMDGLVAPEAVGFGEVPCPSREVIVDLDEIELPEPGIEHAGSLAKLAGSQPSEPVCLSKRGPALGIQKTCADDPIGAVPQGRGPDGTSFGDE